MKRMILTIIICLLFPSILYAEADGPDYYEVQKVASDGVLNIRENSDWKSTKLGEIPYNGTCFQNQGYVGGLTFQEFTELLEEQ